MTLATFDIPVSPHRHAGAMINASSTGESRLLYLVPGGLQTPCIAFTMSSSDFNPYQMMISASEMAYYPSPYGNYMSYGSLGPCNGIAGPFYGAASYGTPCHVPYANMGFSNGYFPMTEGSVPVDNLGAPTETKFPVGSGESINQGPPTSGDQSDSREEQPSPKNHGDEE